MSFGIANDRRNNSLTTQHIFTNTIKSNNYLNLPSGPSSSGIVTNASTITFNTSNTIINATNAICLNASHFIKLSSSAIIIDGSLIITPQLKHGTQVNNPSSGVHGVTGNIVGTSDSQTLTNKNLTSGTNTFPSSLVTLTGAQALANKDLTAGSNIFPTSLITTGGVQTLTNKDLTSGTNTFPASFITTGGVQTLTNKDLTSGTNTFPASFITTGGVQTLTNKDLTSGTNTFPPFVTLTGAQALTNKTITGTTNTVRSTQLATTTNDVVVSAATVPSINQVLTATSSSAANWQTLIAANMTYITPAPANWAGPPPITVASAIDRIAAQLFALFGPIP